MANETEQPTSQANGTGSATPAQSGTSQDGSEMVSKTAYENQVKRAEKAEAELKAKAVQPAPTVQPTPTQPSPAVDVDERILKANGMPDELLTKLKDIAAFRKVNLIDAQKDALFVAEKAQFDKDELSKKASVRSSRGSSVPQAEKTINTPGLTRAEHKALLNK